MLNYKGTQGGIQFCISEKQVNLYNWQKYLPLITDMMHTANLILGKETDIPIIQTRLDNIITGGEDGRVHSIADTLEIIEKLIKHHIKEQHQPPLIQQYHDLVKQTSMQSNKEFATATIIFCLEKIAKN